MYKYSVAFESKLHKFSHEDKDFLLERVIDFFQKNNINFDRASLIKAIERQSYIKSRDKKKLSFKDVITGAKAIIKYSTGDSTSWEEINRRTDICEGCPLKSNIPLCGPCGTAGKITKFISELRSKLKISYPIPDVAKRHYCGVCNCSLALMVVTKIENFNESPNQNLKRPDRCWLKTTSKNYANE